MAAIDNSVSFYLFDIDDNLLILPTQLYLWNAETRTELAINSGELVKIENDLGRTGQWSSWAVRAGGCASATAAPWRSRRQAVAPFARIPDSSCWPGGSNAQWHQKHSAYAAVAKSWAG
jgi:hypothetical protein